MLQNSYTGIRLRNYEYTKGLFLVIYRQHIECAHSVIQSDLPLRSLAERPSLSRDDSLFQHDHLISKAAVYFFSKLISADCTFSRMTRAS